MSTSSRVQYCTHILALEMYDNIRTLKSPRNPRRRKKHNCLTQHFPYLFDFHSLSSWNPYDNSAKPLFYITYLKKIFLNKNLERGKKRPRE